MQQNDSTYGQLDKEAATRAENPMEKMVSTYDTYMRRVTLGREHILRDMTVDLAQVKPGDDVLEVGCGTGTLTLAAKRKAGTSGKVCGIDVLPGMIENSQQKAAAANLDVTFQLGSIDAIPFPDSQFDAVMCSFMIFHMSETVRRKGISEIYRVLKPGGHWMVLDMALPSQPLSRAIARLLFGGMMDHDLRDLIPLMKAAGFSSVETGHSQFKVMGLSVFGYVRGMAQKH
jgi:ubiquinone/menaquinone biosynthesis C-methylase UbiE